MSVTSTDYRYLKYTTNNASINHPSFEYEVDSSFSSFESRKVPPSRTKSVAAIARRSRSSACSSQKARSFISEPVKKKPSLPLTEQVLAMHNSMISPMEPYEYQDNSILEQALLDRVDERCNHIKQEFEDKITKLEAQFSKVEMDFNQTRFDIEELNSMEKEYVNQGIQTDLRNKDIENEEVWKKEAEGLQEFVNKTRKIIWDTSFIPLNAVCRQLPTKHDNDEDQDICDYHRNKLENIAKKSEKEKLLYSNNNQATINRLSNWSKALQQHH